MERLISFAGIFIMLGIALAFSSNWRIIRWKVVAWGISLQVVFALLILGVPAFGIPGVLQPLFQLASAVFNKVLSFTESGSVFVFGSLASSKDFGSVIFAFQILPTIIFFSALMAIGYHLGIMQRVVKVMAIVMQKLMGTSGAETLSVSANVFVGQTEAPLLIRPYVKDMTLSELMTVMVGGMATVSGGIMAAYVGMLNDRIPDIAGHLMTASVMSAPAALAIAKIMIPETETPRTMGGVEIPIEKQDANVIEAAARGAGEGLTLAFNVAAMLLAFIALIFMANYTLVFLGGKIGFADWGGFLVPDALRSAGPPQLSLELIFGWLFYPIAWSMGIPAHESALAGIILGKKIVLNEIIAYGAMAQMQEQLSGRTLIILSYAICGFANFSSIAIQIGGIGGIAPSRRSDLARLGLRAVIGGSLAAFLTATIAGLML
ncbi:MAG: NupC/NupG family nucleoside CNT transporter [Spirochaetales bacterium]|nr:NupC/NupG family nucleoside CNT transporter [Spirochaetales bacterium]